MGLREFFLWQLEHEAAASRKVIERVPEGRNNWKPHARSMELGSLAALVASILAERRIMSSTAEDGNLR